MSIRSEAVMACANRKAVVTQGQMSYLEAPNTAATVSIMKLRFIHFSCILP